MLPSVTANSHHIFDRHSESCNLIPNTTILKSGFKMKQNISDFAVVRESDTYVHTLYCTVK